MSDNTFYIMNQPCLTYKVKNDIVSGKVNNIDSVIQSIQHILSTERYSNPIYDDDYGVELEQFKGKDYNYVEAYIETVIRDALLQDDRIQEVRMSGIEQTGIDSCTVTFEIETIFGQIQEEVDVIY